MKRQESKVTANTTVPSSSNNSSPKPAAASQSKNPTASVSAEIKPSLDDIRRRAYEVYLKRQSTGTPGSPESDWTQAENELTRRR
jgi:hypothetical protein